MHMKIEINHLENPPPPRNLSNPWTNATPRKWSQPLPKKSQTHPKAYLHGEIAPFQKNLNPSRKNLNLPEKVLLPKNSITASLKQSQTLELNLNPFPKNPNPLWKILNPSWKNLNPLRAENLTKPLNNSQPPEYFLTSLKISHTPWTFLNPLNIS